MDINHISEDLLEKIILKLDNTTFILVSYTNIYIYSIFKKLLTNISIKYGGINGYKYNFIYDDIVRKRDNIITKKNYILSNDKSYNFQYLKNWSRNHFTIYGLSNIHFNNTKIAIWLCVDHK